MTKPTAKGLLPVRNGACSVLMILALTAAGCKSADKPVAVTPKVPVQGTMNPNGSFTPNAIQPGQQGTLNPDGTFTPNPVQQPVPAQAAPSIASAPAPLPAPVASNSVQSGSVPSGPTPAPEPVYRTIPAGTAVPVTITETLSASHNEVGDRFTGVLAGPISAGGKTAFARGTRVEGEVVAAKGRAPLQRVGSHRHSGHLHRRRTSQHLRI